MASPEIKTYHGNCHCASFKFNITIPELKSISTCNCSFCSRNAISWIYPLDTSVLFIERGSISELALYQFGEKDMSHYFCKTCGSSLLSLRKSSGALGINARMLRDISLSTLNDDIFHGKDLPPAYTLPIFPSHPDPEPGMQVYNGTCHCTAVTISVVFKQLAELEVLSCNCSLCSRNGELYIYPKASQVVVHTGGDKLSEYAFLSKESLHTFCRVCGVSVLVRVLEDGDPVCPVNGRVFEGVDVEGVKKKNYDGWSKGVEYVIR